MKKETKKDLKKRDQIVEMFAKLNEEYDSVKMEDLMEAGYPPGTIKHYFPSLTKLEEVAREEYPDSFHDIDIEDLLSQKAIKELRKAVRNHKRFVVTTAVTGCSVDEKFYASIKTYCKKKDAKLLILMASDPAHTKSRGGYGSIDKQLAEECVVLEDTELNSNIFLSTIKLSAKHIDPITGLDRIGQREGTFIFASPKQRMHLAATSNEKLPHALMTTGAITIPNYVTDLYMSERTAYIANNDHVMGAIIVEIVDNKEYHYRQVQSLDDDGSFIDAGNRYSPAGVQVYNPIAIVPGDWHSGETDEDVRGVVYQLLDKFKPKYLILHDAFNGLSVNHHEEGNNILKAMRAQSNQLNIEQELRMLAKDLNKLSSFGSKIVMVKSNHDEFLSKHYLQKGKYVDDPHNHHLSLKLALSMLEGKDPLQVGVEMMGLLDKSKVVWLKRDEDFKIAGIQLGAHGDQGPNGSKGSLRTMEKSFGMSVTGHSHTPGILRGAWAVGTSSYLKLSYNEGPSSWLHTLCLVYENGSRQLINIIDGKWCL